MATGQGRARAGRTSRRRGFSLIELMMTTALVGVLAATAGTEADAARKRAKRVEAVVGLKAVWKAQMIYFSETGHFANGFDQLGFAVTGGTQLSTTAYKGSVYTYQLSQPWGANSFYCIATGNLDADAFPDVLEIYEQGR